MKKFDENWRSAITALIYKNRRLYQAMTRLRVRENGTVKKRRDSRTSKDVLDEAQAQARHKLNVLAMMALYAQQQGVDPTPYVAYALVNGLVIEDIQRDRNSLTAPIERRCLNFENANPGLPKVISSSGFRLIGICLFEDSN